MIIANGEELRRAMSQALKNASSAKFCVAYWGAGAGETLAEATSNTEIMCDLMSGATNPFEIKRLIEKGADVRHVDDLHAKFAIIGAWCYLGSSNMSSNGIGSEGGEAAKLHELNCVSSDAAVLGALTAWWEHLRASSKPVKRDMLKEAERRWRERRILGALGSLEDIGLGAFLQSTIERQADAPVQIALYPPLDTEYDGVSEEAVTETQARLGQDFELFFDWEDLPSDTILLCFEVRKSGRLVYQGPYVRTSMHPDIVKRKGGTRHSFQIVQKKAFELPSSHRIALSHKLKRTTAFAAVREAQEGRLVSLSDISSL